MEAEIAEKWANPHPARERLRRRNVVAKRHGRPVVVLHRVERAESRSFLYLGNVPELRFTKELKQLARG